MFAALAARCTICAGCSCRHVCETGKKGMRTRTRVALSGHQDRVLKIESELLLDTLSCALRNKTRRSVLLFQNKVSKASLNVPKRNLMLVWTSVKHAKVLFMYMMLMNRLTLHLAPMEILRYALIILYYLLTGILYWYQSYIRSYQWILLYCNLLLPALLWDYIIIFELK